MREVSFVKLEKTDTSRELRIKKKKKLYKMLKRNNLHVSSNFVRLKRGRKKTKLTKECTFLEFLSTVTMCIQKKEERREGERIVERKWGD